MKSSENAQPPVLGITPCVHGVGYALFEGPTALLDWGVRYVTSEKNRKSIEKVEELLSTYEPRVVILEDYDGEGSRRQPRVRSLIRMIARRAEKRGIVVVRFSRGDIRECFEPYKAKTKHDIAKQIIKWHPELKRHLPQKRKPWLPEKPNMAMFDAAALSLVYYKSAD